MAGPPPSRVPYNMLHMPPRSTRNTNVTHKKKVPFVVSITLSDEIDHFLPSAIVSKFAKALEACCLVLSSLDLDKVSRVSLPPMPSMRSLFKADKNSECV